MKTSFIMLAIFATSPLRAADPPGHRAPESVADLLFLESHAAKIGIDRSKGAAITWLSWKDYPKNSVNIHDPGRLIQQSYYAGRRIDRTSEGQSKAWSPWTWNPIQGGGVGSWAKVMRFEKQDSGTLFSATTPKLWDMPDEDAQAVMHQWTRFEADMPNVIVVRNELIANRAGDDRWGPAQASHQELPACYFTRNFSIFEIYTGEGHWETVAQAPGPPWGRAKPPRKAMACFNKEGQGIAIFSPTSGDTWNFGPHVNATSDDPAGGPCVHIAPISTVRLGPQSTFEYRYWLIVGDRASISVRLEELWSSYSKERSKLTNEAP